IVPKHQRSVNGIEDKILGLYATGMTTRDISEPDLRTVIINIIEKIPL
ncbi:hypothetical protein SAMN04487886_13073, partial [Clostridium sp. DSM 8431]